LIRVLIQTLKNEKDFFSMVAPTGSPHTPNHIFTMQLYFEQK